MSSAPATRAFSGKRLTIVLLIVLLSTGGLFYWVTTSYSTYNAARRQTDRDWRELATLLESRYAAIDQRIAQAAAQQNIDDKLLAEWRAARDTFKGTGISGLQIASAEKVESVIDQLPKSIDASDTLSPELSSSLEKYESSAKKQREIGGTTGSRLLKIMLNLPDPKDISLH